MGIESYGDQKRVCIFLVFRSFCCCLLCLLVLLSVLYSYCCYNALTLFLLHVVQERSGTLMDGWRILFGTVRVWRVMIASMLLSFVSSLLGEFIAVVPGVDLGGYAFSLQPLVLFNTETKSTRVRLAGDSKLGHPVRF